MDTLGVSENGAHRFVPLQRSRLSFVYSPRAVDLQPNQQFEASLTTTDEFETQHFAKLLVIETVPLHATVSTGGSQYSKQHEGLVLD